MRSFSGSVLLAALAECAASAVVIAPPAECDFASSYPRQYVSPKLASPLVLDGKLDEAAWTEVPWTSDFVDISTRRTPRLKTRAKIRWTDDFLYVGALLEEPQLAANISWCCHCNTTTADQVIFHDNDFEVFVDADGSTHNYKETEVNAANLNGTSATWDLLLDKPYDDGGSENSSRVFGAAGFDMQPPLAVRSFSDGVLNDPARGGSFWSVEIALPMARLVYGTSARLPIADGDIWRINFSRVEWALAVVNGAYWKEPACTSCPVPGTNAEDNWVWSPQGSIAMHLPERWGILQYSTAPPNATAPARYAEWPIRSAAIALYYAEKAFFAAKSTYAASASELLPYTPTPFALDGTCAPQPSIAVPPGGASFAATLVSGDGRLRATIDDSRYLRVYAV